MVSIIFLSGECTKITSGIFFQNFFCQIKLLVLISFLYHKSWLTSVFFPYRSKFFLAFPCLSLWTISLLYDLFSVHVQIPVLETQNHCTAFIFRRQFPSTCITKCTRTTSTSLVRAASNRWTSTSHSSNRRLGWVEHSIVQTVLEWLRWSKIFCQCNPTPDSGFKAQTAYLGFWFRQDTIPHRRRPSIADVAGPPRTLVCVVFTFLSRIFLSEDFSLFFSEISMRAQIILHLRVFYRFEDHWNW